MAQTSATNRMRLFHENNFSQFEPKNQPRTGRNQVFPSNNPLKSYNMVSYTSGHNQTYESGTQLRSRLNF